jgi:hypothetical protein
LSRFVVQCAWLVRGAFTVLISGCGVPPWPVPVPAETAVDGSPARFGVALPLCGGTSSCPERDALRRFLAAQVQRCRATPAPAPLPSELEAVVSALGTKVRLGTNDFPRSASSLPEAFRTQKSYVAIDGGSPVHEDASAVPYSGFWWTFWDRQPLTETPVAKDSSYAFLIVFPEFEGRDPCASFR